MAVTRCDQGVFCMCMYELGKSRVDEAYINSSHSEWLASQELYVYLFEGRSRLLRESHSPLNDLCQ